MKVSPITVIVALLGSAAFFIAGMFTGHRLTKDGKWFDAPVKAERSGTGATTKFRVLVSSPSDPGLGKEFPNADASEFWLHIQLKSIAAGDTLERVVKAKKLDVVWGVPAPVAVDKLGEITEVARIKGTDIAELTVWDANPGLAADLANAVRDAYVQRREELEVERAHRLTTATGPIIEEQTKKVSAARLKMVELEQQKGIAEATPLNSPESGVSADRDGPARAPSEYAAAKYAYEAEQQLLNTMREHLMRTQVHIGVTQKPIEILEIAKPRAK